jgi:hypothetical protein
MKRTLKLQFVIGVSVLKVISLLHQQALNYLLPDLLQILQKILIKIYLAKEKFKLKNSI